MATRDGAKALGRKTGVISEGYVADLIVLDLDQVHLMPVHNVVDTTVYSARGSDVVMNMARGTIIYREGVHLTMDVAALRRELHDYAVPHLFG